LTEKDTNMSTPFFDSDAVQTDETFDAITFDFMDEWESGETTGRRPTLGEYVRRYPQYADRLTDFVLSYIRLQRSDENISYEDASFPESVRAGARVREALGLPEYVTGEEAETVPGPTFADLMKEANVSVVRLSKQLGVKSLFINRIQRGLLADWTGATARLLAGAMNRTADEIHAALRASVNASRTPLAGAHFSAQNGDPDLQAVQGTPQPLADILTELQFSPEERAKWLADE
jgi:hypothetical protein